MVDPVGSSLVTNALLKPPLVLWIAPTRGKSRDEVSPAVELLPGRSFEREPNPLGVRSRFDDQVVLELPVVAVEHQVDSRVNLVVLHARKVGNVRSPLSALAPDEVVTLSLRRFDSAGRDTPRPGPPHAQAGPCSCRASNSPDCLGGREEKLPGRT